MSAADAGRIALVDAKSGTETSYGDLVSRIDAFAGGLAARGIGVGDVVATAVPQQFGFRDRVPRHPARGRHRHHRQRTVHRARHHQATQGFEGAPAGHGERAAAAGARGALAAAGLTEDQVVVLDGDGLGAEGPAPEVSFDPATHLAALPYSSGTTANPKGVMLYARQPDGQRRPDPPTAGPDLR